MRKSDIPQFEPDDEGLPALDTLCRYEQWVCWKNEYNKKPPLNPETGERASTTDPTTWSEFGTAYGFAIDNQQKVDGLGFMLTAETPFVGIDLDDCRDPDTGHLNQRAKKFVEKFDSYTEISPSGTGLHIIIKGEKPVSRCGVEGVEIYEMDRYLTFTGQHVRETPSTIKNRETVLDDVYQSYTDGEYVGDIDAKSLNANTDIDHNLISIAEAALRDLQSESAHAFKTVMGFLQGGIADFDTQALTKERDKIDRSAADFVALSLLYGTLQKYYDHEDEKTIDIIQDTYTFYCQKHRHTPDRQPRRWLIEDRRYRQYITAYAVNAFCPSRFRRILNRTSNYRSHKSGEPSDVTVKVVLFSLDMLTTGKECPEMIETRRELDQLIDVLTDEYNLDVTDVRSELIDSLTSTTPLSKNVNPPGITTGTNSVDSHSKADPRYPTANEVADLAQATNPSREKSYYKKTLRELQRKHGQVTMAYCPSRPNGKRYVYYYPNMPDPNDAEKIKRGNEVR